ncbi:hypothetical protein Emag_003186 [Eimeria magna]
MTAAEEEASSLSDFSGFASEVQRLMSACRAATRPKTLLENCEKLFRLLRDKRLEFEVLLASSSSSFASSSSFSSSVQSPDEGVKQRFIQWLRQAFNTFVLLAFELVESAELHVQKLGLSYLFRTLKLEAQIHQSASFPLSVFQTFTSKLLQSNNFSDQLQETIVTDYAARFLDIRYYLLVVIAKILREFSGQKNAKRSTPADLSESETEENHPSSSSATALESPDISFQNLPWYAWTKGEAELSSRLTSLLLKISEIFLRNDLKSAVRKKKRKERANTEREGGSDSEGIEEKDDDESICKTFIRNLQHSKALQIANHRLVYQKAWLLLLLEIEHDRATTQKLLSRVPRAVMPLLSNPLMLAGFFLKSFNNSEQLSLSISALSGMFYLLAKHRLGNPDVVDKSSEGNKTTESDEAQAAGSHFYQRLYRLLTPAAFSPRFRVRFLRLLNMALRSDLLPTSLVAAFIKKCCRVACVVSPAATLCLEALVLSLLQKYHSTCKPLLSLPEHVAARLRVPGDIFDYCNVKLRENMGELSSADEDDDEMVETDRKEESLVFELVNASLPTRLQISKTDICPLTRKEARMSLWEVDLLGKHALKSVRQLTEMFDNDISNPAAKKICVDDFLDVTTGSLLSRELKALEKSSCITSPAFEASAVPADVHILHRCCMKLAG